MKTCICCGCILREHYTGGLICDVSLDDMREDKEDDNEEVKNVKRIKFI